MEDFEKPTAFHVWLRKQHLSEIAYLLGVCEQTVRHWIMYNKLPKDALKKKLVHQYEGTLAFEDFYMS